MRILQSLTLICSTLLLVACEAKVSNRGHVDENNIKESIEIGVTSKKKLIREFGSPSSTSNFGDETWYYIQSRKEAHAFFKPEITEQIVTQVTFDEEDKVASVTQYNEEDAHKVISVGKTTATEGHSLTFMEQMLGNLGRFNKGRDSATGSRRAGGGSPGGPGL